LAKEIMAEPDPRELDMIASTGEQVSVGLLAMALIALGKKAVSYTGWQVAIKTDSAHTKARIGSIDDTKVKADLEAGKIVIITGFQGANEKGDITTLGRGGSDTSAVAVAAALKAQECLIYTDVDGVYTTDPRVVSDARRLNTITFEEMLEMASLGSKVLQIRSVEFAGNYRMPTRVLSSLTDPLMPLEIEKKSGTLISFEEDINMEQASITGIAFNRDEAKVTIFGVPDTPGVAYKILGPIAEANIEVDMIIQNQSVEGITDFTFTVPRADFNRAMEVLNEDFQKKLGSSSIVGNSKVSKVSVVGVGMRSHVGVASQMFQTLAEESINIQMISTSEIKISVLIDEKYMELAVRALHKAFGLEEA
jgi:aspartate kinase